MGAGADGRQHLLRLGGGEDENEVLRRLFDNLEQRVEALRGDHVRLVDDEYPVPGFSRGVKRSVPEVAGIVHAAVAGCVELDDIDRSGALGASATHDGQLPTASLSVRAGSSANGPGCARWSLPSLAGRRTGRRGRSDGRKRGANGSATCSWPTTWGTSPGGTCGKEPVPRPRGYRAAMTVLTARGAPPAGHRLRITEPAIARPQRHPSRSAGARTTHGPYRGWRSRDL